MIRSTIVLRFTYIIRSIITLTVRDQIYYYTLLTWSDLLLRFPYMIRSIITFSLHDQIYYYVFLTWSDLLLCFPCMVRSIITLYSHVHIYNYVFLTWSDLLSFPYMIRCIIKFSLYLQCTIIARARCTVRDHDIHSVVGVKKIRHFKPGDKLLIILDL